MALIDVKPMKGNDLKVKVNGETLAMAKSVEVVVTCDVREVAREGVNGARCYVAGMIEWEATVNHLIGNLNYKFDLLLGEEVMLSFVNAKDPDGDIINGRAICVQSKTTGTRGALVQGSWKFKGTGWLGSWVNVEDVWKYIGK